MSEPIRPAPGGSAGPAPRGATLPELREALPDRRSRRRLAAVLVGSVAVIVLMAVSIVVGWRPPASGPPSSGTGPEASTSDASAAADEREEVPAAESAATVPELPTVRIGGVDRDEEASPEPRASDPAGLLRVLRECVADEGDSATERAWRFEQAVRGLADSWASFERTTVDEASRLVAQCVIAASSEAAALDDVFAVVSQGAAPLGGVGRLAAHEVWAAAWSCGMLAHLAALEDAPQAVRGRASAGLAGLGPGSTTGGFWGGATLALDAMPARIAGIGDASGDAGTAGAWRRWSQAVSSAWGADAGGRERALLRGVGDLLDSASDRASDPMSRSIALQILAQVDWGEKGAGRDAIIAWLDDEERISSRELAAVTQWMVSGAPASNLGVDHVLSASASGQDRARARDALAALWGLNSPAMAESARAQWAAAARSALSLGDHSGPDAFARTAKLARLGAAAALLRRGDAAQARLALAAAAEGRRAGTGGGVGTLGAESAGRDGRWAVRFLAARRNAAERRSALAGLGVDSATLGVVDAEVLVEAALFGSPVDVRTTATRIAERHASEATVMNALLEQLARAPRTAAASRLYERAARASLPPIRDKDWPIEARRALVSHLLEALDAGDGLAALDEWAAAIASAYESWSATLSARAGSAERESSAEGEEAALAGEGQADEAARGARRVVLDPAEAAEAALADLRVEIAALGDPGATQVLSTLERRQSARRMLAQGSMQRFVAEQAGVVDALALLVSTERPSAAGAASEIVERAERERREADVVDAQAERTQRAILELWLLLLDPGART